MISCFKLCFSSRVLIHYAVIVAVLSGTGRLVQHQTVLFFSRYDHCGVLSHNTTTNSTTKEDFYPRVTHLDDLEIIYRNMVVVGGEGPVEYPRATHLRRH